MDSLVTTCDNITLQCFYLAREGSRLCIGTVLKKLNIKSKASFSLMLITCSYFHYSCGLSNTTLQ